MVRPVTPHGSGRALGGAGLATATALVVSLGGCSAVLCADFDTKVVAHGGTSGTMMGPGGASGTQSGGSGNGGSGGAGCTGGRMACDGGCVDLAVDPANCGVC